MCPAGTHRSLRSCAVDPAQRPPGAEEVAQWADGSHGTVLFDLNLVRLIKRSSLPSAPASGQEAVWGRSRFTSIGNEHSQIVTFVLTFEESTPRLTPMCSGVMERFRLASQPVQKLLYVDRGCCRSQGTTGVRLDIFHWIHRFDAESHCKYAVFKSALAGAVLAHNRPDLELLMKAIRAKNPESLGRGHCPLPHLQGSAQAPCEEGYTRCSGDLSAHPAGHRGDERSRWAGRERS
ncbi:uncharacterized protein LOC120829988 [Gasterosteus aculeatus]